MNRNLGDFQVSQECHSLSCPICGEEFEDINTVAIRGMQYSYEGKKVVGEKVCKQIYPFKFKS